VTDSIFLQTSMSLSWIFFVRVVEDHGPISASCQKVHYYICPPFLVCPLLGLQWWAFFRGFGCTASCGVDISLQRTPDFSLLDVPPSLEREHSKGPDGLFEGTGPIVLIAISCLRLRSPLFEGSYFSPLDPLFPVKFCSWLLDLSEDVARCVFLTHFYFPPLSEMASQPDALARRLLEVFFVASISSFSTMPLTSLRSPFGLFRVVPLHDTFDSFERTTVLSRSPPQSLS